MKIKVTNVRLSFPDLFTAKQFNGTGDAKYKATFLIPVDSGQHKKIEAAILEVAIAKWGPVKGPQIVKQIRNNPNKFCYQDGANKSYDGYQGMFALSAANKLRPLVLGADRSPLTADSGKPYSGCYVNGILELFAYENSGNGISASLGGVQFVRDGDAFVGGRVAAADEFDEITDGADAADLF